MLINVEGPQMASLLTLCKLKHAWTWLVSRDPCRKIPVGHFRRCSILALRAPAQRIQPLAQMGLKTGSVDVLCTPA
jgi:hypothetical protein